MLMETSPLRSVLQRSILLFATAILLLTLPAVAWSGPPATPAATPPQQPATGELGGNGPCSKGYTHTGFTSMGSQVWLFQPAGSGAPRTGGRCNDSRRPVVFIAHGATAIIPLVYGEVINNMVSNGYMVVYTNHTMLWNPSITYPQVALGARYAHAWLNVISGRRMDLANIGIWGHSSGGGMVPWLAQQLDSYGWGRQSMWLSMNAPYLAFKVGDYGPIDIPSHARVQVINFEEDDKSNMDIGVNDFESLDVPDSQKDHITILSDRGIVSDHSVPGSWLFVSLPNSHLDYYGVFRTYQALGDCARVRVNCDVDLTYMGTWSDGVEATRAIVSDDPVDIGPPAPDGCTFFAAAEKFGMPHMCVRTKRLR